MATSIYGQDNIIISLNTSDGEIDVCMHNANVAEVSDKTDGGSTITFTHIPSNPDNIPNIRTSLTIDVTESVNDINQLVIANGGVITNE